MYNQHRDQFNEYHERYPLLPIPGAIQQWPQPQLALTQTAFYNTSPVPVHVAFGHVPNVVTPSIPDSESIVVPVIVSKNFNVPPPGFLTKSEYLAQSQETRTQPYVAEPSTTQHIFSPDAPEFVPSSRQGYEPQKHYQVALAEKPYAVPSVSGSHHNFQTQHQYQKNINKHHQGGYNSHQENQFPSTHRGSQLHQLHNTNPGTYDQRRVQERTNSDGMTKTKKDTNKGASNRPPWSNVPQKEKQMKDASETSSQTSTSPLSNMPSIHSMDELSPAQNVGNKMFNVNKQHKDIHDTRSGQKSYRYPGHHQTGQYVDPNNSHIEGQFGEYNKPYISINHSHTCQNQKYHNSNSYDSFNAGYNSYYSGFIPQTRQFINRSFRPRMPQQAWMQRSNFNRASRGHRYNYSVDAGSLETYHPDRRLYHNSSSAEFNPDDFDVELYQNNHRQQYPKQNWQHSQRGSRTEAEFYHSRSSGHRPFHSGNESLVHDSESLNDTSSSNDVEPDDDIKNLDLNYDDERHTPAQDTEQYAESSSDPRLTVVIPVDSAPVPSKVEPSSIKNVNNIEAAKSCVPLEKTEELFYEATEKPNDNKDVEIKLSLAELTGSVDQSPLEADQTPKHVDKTPKQIDQSPKQVHQTPKQVDQSPKQIDETLKQVDQTPKQIVKIPKQGDQTSIEADQTPKQKELSIVDLKKEKLPDKEPKTIIDKVTATVHLKNQESFGHHGDKHRFNEGSRNHSDFKRVDNAHNSQRTAENNFERNWQDKGREKSWQHRGATSESPLKDRHISLASDSMPKPTPRNIALDTNRMYGAGRQNADRTGNGSRVNVQRSNSDSYSNALKGKRTVYNSSKDTANPKVQAESRINLEEKMSKNKMTARQMSVLLDDYNSDLNLIVDAGGYGAFTVETPLGFSKLWADCKATHGVLKGKSYFEVKLMDLIDESLPEENDQRPNVLRIGWSAENAVFEVHTGSWSFGYKESKDSIQGEAFCETTAKDDVLAAMVNFDVDPVEISYLKNGEAVGQTAFFTPSLKNSALFPHISLKNCKVRVNFGQRDSPWYPPPEGFSFIGKCAVSELSPSLTPPVKKSDCELIMMIGLSGSGKTTWASQRQEEHRDRRYNILGTDLLVELMRASNNGLQGSETNKDLFSLAEGCYKRLLTIASMKARNYILDEDNVQASTRAEKLRKFHPFNRRAVIVQPSQRDLELRREKLLTAGRSFPAHVLKEMESSFTLPDRSEDFKFIDFVGLKEPEAKKQIEKYQGSSHSKSPMLALD